MKISRRSLLATTGAAAAGSLLAPRTAAAQAGVDGSKSAALFLKEFAGGLPWVHMDIAGTAWADEDRPFMPKGATGVAVRTLAELAFETFA